MQKIVDLQNFPDGTPIEAIQGRITAVYPARSVTGAKGTSTVQNAELSDIGGNKVKLTVWDHPDLNPLKDNECVLHNTGGQRYPGIKVKHGSYVAQKDGRTHKAGDTIKTLELNVTKNGCFQHVEVYNQSKPADKPAAEAVSRPSEARPGAPLGAMAQSGYINGMTVGMAINNAVKLIADEKGGYVPETFAKDLYVIASDIIRVSQHIEKGNLAEKKGEKTVGKAPEPAKPAPVAAEVPEDDVPF